MSNLLIDCTDLSEFEESMMLRAGVSRRLFRVRYSLNEQLRDIPEDKAGKPVSWKALQHDIDGFFKAPLGRPRLVVITADAGELTARGLALAMLRSALSVHKARSDAGETDDVGPIWHNVYGGRFDSLRDSYARQALDERPCALVLDNLHIDMAPDKADRMRDLIRLFETQTRIVVAIGCDPYQFVRRRYMPEVDLAIYLKDVVGT